MFKAKILTIFPEIFPGFLGTSLTGRALKENKWELETINIRDYAFDKHGSVDDTPCGGGAGMIMRPDVLGNAIEHNYTQGKIIYMSPNGRPLTQQKVREVSKEDNITIICGRFEGIDERVLHKWSIQEISVGDFVLSGGEPALLTMLDATVRLIDGVLGNAESIQDESFSNNLLEYPQYTKPQNWENRLVPDVLISGHHGNIRKWRQEQSELLTKTRRPDLYEKYLAQTKKGS